MHATPNDGRPDVNARLNPIARTAILTAAALALAISTAAELSSDARSWWRTVEREPLPGAARSTALVLANATAVRLSEYLAWGRFGAARNVEAPVLVIGVDAKAPLAPMRVLRKVECAGCGIAPAIEVRRRTISTNAS